MTQSYSVLMSVYSKENPNFLREAMDSIWMQTIPPEDFVLVCDGVLTSELYALIDSMKESHPNLNIIKLDQNKGLANALNIGIKYCKNELVARMDSDDISLIDRCKNQLELFSKDQDLCICSGVVEEFNETPDNISAKRALPTTNEEIRRFAKIRCPFNHPCVMYKRSAVIEAGGYPNEKIEDYYLWINMLKKSFKAANLDKTLLLMRAGGKMYDRRSGLKYFRSHIFLQNYMLRIHFISFFEYVRNIIFRFVFIFSLSPLRIFLYSVFCRQ